MTYKIFVSGGGDIGDSFSFDELFFKSIPGTSTILYIPTAMATTSARKESCYDWFSKLIAHHSIKGREIDFHMWDEISRPIDINMYSAVYVGGGNTYRLSGVLNKTGMFDELKSFIACGGIYYGGSAGGIILGKSLLTVEEENITNEQNSAGGDLLRGLSVFPHFSHTETSTNDIKQLCKEHSLKVVAIPENAGIVLGDDSIIAFGEISIFEHEKQTIIYSSGDTIR